MKTIAFLIVIPAIIIIGACSHDRKNNSIEDSHYKYHKTYHDIRIITSDSCLARDERKKAILTTIASAILPTLVDATVDILASAIQSASEDDVVTETGHVNIEVPHQPDNTFPQCILIVSGDFFSSKEEYYKKISSYKDVDTPEEEIFDPLDIWSLYSDKVDRKDKYQAQYKRKLGDIMGIYLASQPGLFYEGELTPSKDGSALAISTNLLIYNGLEQSSKKSRDIVFTFSISGESALGPDSKVSIGSITFKKLFKGDRIIYDKNGKGSQWVPISVSNQKKPRTIFATVTETEKADKFLKHLNTVISGSKEELKKGLKGQAAKLVAPKASEEEKLLTRISELLADKTLELNELGKKADAEKQILIFNKKESTYKEANDALEKAEKILNDNGFSLLEAEAKLEEAEHEYEKFQLNGSEQQIESADLIKLAAQANKNDVEAKYSNAKTERDNERDKSNAAKAALIDSAGNVWEKLKLANIEAEKANSLIPPFNKETLNHYRSFIDNPR